MESEIGQKLYEYLFDHVISGVRLHYNLSTATFAINTYEYSFGHFYPNHIIYSPTSFVAFIKCQLFEIQSFFLILK